MTILEKREDIYYFIAHAFIGFRGLNLPRSENYKRQCNSLPEYLQGMKKLAQHSCPVQVVWGVKDEMLLWKPQAEKVTELLKIKSFDVHLIRANHFLQEEQPAEVAKLIKAFISN